MRDRSGSISGAVWRYLDAVARSAASDADARVLAAAWRALLLMHETTPCGDCARCRCLRARGCTVWQVAIGFLGREVHRGARRR